MKRPSLLLAFLPAVLILSAGFLKASSGSRLDHLRLPGEGHLASAQVPTSGPALVSWISTEGGWSRVIAYEGGEPAQEWYFEDVLVKGVRWIEPGETLRLGVVDAHGSDTRVYAIRNDGQLRLLGSTRGVGEGWQDVSLSLDGTLWLGYSLDAHEATVGVGRLGRGAPTAQWKVSVPTRVSSQAIHDLDQAGFIYRSGRQPLIALLWKGHLWLSELDGSRSVEIEPPGDCDQVQHFTATDDGFWVQCGRGFAAKPGFIWGYYRSEIPAQGAHPVAESLGVFRSPWFRSDGSVVSRDRQRGTLEIAVPVPGEEEVRRIGTLHLSPPGRGARWVPAGDALLETIGTSEEYRVLHLGAELARLRARSGS